MLFALFSSSNEYTLRGWCKLTLLLNVLFGPLIWAYTIDRLFDLELINSFWIYVALGCALALSIILVIIVLITLRTDTVPPYFSFYSWFGFFTAMAICYLAFLECRTYFATMFVSVFDTKEALLLLFVPLGNAYIGEFIIFA